MSAVVNKADKQTSHSTKSVFMRAEHGDGIVIRDTLQLDPEVEIPADFTVIERELTYFGPRLRVESINRAEQYLLTAPGPNSEAQLWENKKKGWERSGEVILDFADELPQYDICHYCNEPISTIEHRRRSVIGTCGRTL